MIEKGMPSRRNVKYRKHIEPIRSQIGLARYVTKAKTKGFKKDGTFSTDKWRSKRKLFKKGLKLSKHGKIGDFWVIPRPQLLQEIIDKETRIKNGLKNINVEQLGHAFQAVFGAMAPSALRIVGYYSDRFTDLANAMFGNDRFDMFGLDRYPDGDAPPELEETKLSPSYAAIKREWLSRRREYWQQHTRI